MTAFKVAVDMSYTVACKDLVRPYATARQNPGGALVFNGCIIKRYPYDLYRGLMVMLPSS